MSIYKEKAFNKNEQQIFIRRKVEDSYKYSQRFRNQELNSEKKVLTKPKLLNY